MRSILIAFGTLTLLAVSPALAEGRTASHVIGDDQDQPAMLATDTRVSGNSQASYVLKFAYAPGKARVVKPAFAQRKSHVIGRDN